MYGSPSLLTQNIQGEEYLCLSKKAEKTYMQPLRLVMGLALGPYIMATSHKLPKGQEAPLFTVGAAISLIHVWSWYKANKKMHPPHNIGLHGG
jgi:hypothetical protein